MTYQVELSSAARRQLKKLDPDIKDDVAQAIEALKFDPRPYGVLKLQGEDNAYRVRVKQHRVIYEIYDEVLVVIVIKIGPRRDVYRD